MVIFVTGLCQFHCWYCPVNQEKMYRDVTYADEAAVHLDEDLLVEARAIDALGAGITGGDPMDMVDRVCHYIRLLKAEFGPRFHTHLYTPTTDEEKLRKVAAAGLDEIRFHPFPPYWAAMDRSPYGRAFELCRELGMRAGVEIPLLPNKKADLVALIRWLEARGVDFINLNELEFSEANWWRVKKLGYTLKGELSYGAAGCDEVARELLRLPVKHTTIHYCSSGYKDAVQLRNRIKRRAENVAKPYDVITDDGTLLRGIVEGDDLGAIVKLLREEYEVPEELVAIDPERGRVEVAPWILEEIAKGFRYRAFMLEEYPTADHLEVERMEMGS